MLGLIPEDHELDKYYTIELMPSSWSFETPPLLLIFCALAGVIIQMRQNQVVYIRVKNSLKPFIREKN